MSMQSIQNSIAEINAEKPFAAAHAVTATTYVFDLSAVADPVASDGGFLCDVNGRNQPLLVLQSDVDFAYELSTDPAVVVDPAAAIVIPANQQEYVRPIAETGRYYLGVIRAGTSDGTAKVFRSAGAK